MPQRYTIQKLQTPLSNGENLIFRVDFFPDSTLPQIIDIYYAGNIVYTLKDDGVFPDIVARDFTYSFYIQEDINFLLTKISELETKVMNDGYISHFDGHIASIIKAEDFTLFDKTSFSNFEEVPINAKLVDIITCGDNILKQNSLFITDLAVIEDINRTYNVQTGVGNPQGNWTFGKMMQNMANTPVTGVSAKDFLKSWINSLRITKFTVLYFLAPWISKAQGLNGVHNQISLANWETFWDNTNEIDLIKHAPFRLMSIVNRLDLRGNTFYNQTITNAGETRFIFTLVDPFTGDIPLQNDNDFNTLNLIDWKGFNVIFEYGNVQNNLCDIQNFALQWYNLSSLTLGTTQYNDALEQITNTVTAANAAPNKPNGSAINRIRTNEKIFDDNGIPKSNARWDAMNWQLRQMEINNNTKLFELANVTNVPLQDIPNMDDYNDAYNVDRGGGASNLLINWAFSSPVIKQRIINGNFNIPDNLLSPIATITKEVVDIYGFDYTQVPGYNINNQSLEVKQIENQLSLNTCQGCHAGNTDIDFTHVVPTKYGVPATYWNTYPDMATSGLAGINTHDGAFDDRFYNTAMVAGINVVGNKGATFDNFLQVSVPNRNVIAHAGPLQRVSPFLTGRRYRPNAPSPWEDDELNNQSESPVNGGAGDDNSLNGFFYVNDAHNRNLQYMQHDGVYPKIHTKKWGFNDLEMRKQHLCNLLALHCNSPFPYAPPKPVSITLMQMMDFLPFPKGGH